MSLRQIFAEGGAARANWLKQMGFDLFLHGHFFFPLCASLSPAWLAAGPGPTLSCPCSGLLGLMLLPLLLAADLRVRLSRPRYYAFKISITVSSALSNHTNQPELRCDVPCAGEADDLGGPAGVGDRRQGADQVQVTRHTSPCLR